MTFSIKDRMQLSTVLRFMYKRMCDYKIVLVKNVLL